MTKIITSNKRFATLEDVDVFVDELMLTTNCKTITVVPVDDEWIVEWTE